MAIAHDAQTVGTAYTSTGTQNTTHNAAAGARCAVVLIDQNGSTTDEVSGVTYGGVAMNRLRSDTESTEAGRVYIYWLDNIAGGSQTVAMTTTGSTNKQLVVATMTVAAGFRVEPFGSGSTNTSSSGSNPSLTLSGIVASTAVVAYEVIHSGLQTMTATPQTTPAWTLISSTDLGSQGRGFARIANTPSGTTLTAGWIAATADDYVISGVAFYEVSTTNVAAATPNNQTNTSIPIPLPTITPGEWNVIDIVGEVTSATNNTFTTPAGWTKIDEAFSSNATASVTAVSYIRQYQAGDPTTVTVSWTNAGQAVAGATRYAEGDIDATTPVGETNFEAKGTSTTAYNVALTTTNPGIVRSFFGNRSGHTFSAYSMTDLIDKANSSAASIGVQDSNGSQSAGSFTLTATGSGSTGVGSECAYLLRSPNTSTTAPATEATGSGTANDGVAKVTPNATEAVATGTAYNATVATDDVISSGASGNSTAPAITFPSTIKPGQNIYILLTQNNTDAITAAPTELQALDASTPSGGGQGASNLYRMVADSSTASSTITWTLSATRNWSISWVALSGAAQDPLDTYNVLSPASDTVTATTTFTAESATSTGTGFVLEFFGAKANGVALTDLSVGGSMRRLSQQMASTGTFGSNTAVAILPGGPAAAGAYGGETWTTDQSVVTTFRYTIVVDVNPGTAAGTGDALAFDAAVSVVALPSEAAATGTAAWDSGDVVDSIAVGDNPIAATGEAFDATVSTAVTTTATPTEAAGTGAANDATIALTANATEAAATGTALDGAGQVKPSATEATASGSALDAAPQVSPVDGGNAGSGTAGDGTAQLLVNATEATATGAAYDATVSTTANGTATPQEAAGTGTALDATTAITSSSGVTEATGGSAANDAAPALAVPGFEATGTGDAFDAFVLTTANGTAPSQVAAAVGAAFDAIIAVSFTATEATALAVAADALARLVTSPTEAVGSGAAGTPATVPVGRAESGAATSAGARAGSPVVAVLEAARPATRPAAGSDAAAPHAETGTPTTPRAGG